MRIASNREATLRLWADDEGGVLTDAASTPVLSVKDWDAVAISPAPGSVSHESTGVYAAQVPGQSALKVLTANWTYTLSGGTFQRSTSQQVFVVRERSVPLWMYREDPELEELGTTNLIRLADVVDDWLESALYFPLVETPFDVQFSYANRNASKIRVPGVAFPLTLDKWTVDGTALTDDQLALLQIAGTSIQLDLGSNNSFLTGVSWNAPSWRGGRYEVRGTYGPRPDWSGVVPGDLQRAAVILGRYAARQGKNYPERASQISDEQTLIYFSTPSPGKPTGLPEVDGVVTRYALNSAV